jgi:hypothetical protein
LYLTSKGEIEHEPKGEKMPRRHASEKKYWACESCGLRASVKINIDDVATPVFRKGEPCPICKVKVKVIRRPEKETYGSLKAAKAAKEGKPLKKPRKKAQREGGGRTFVPRAAGRTPGLDPTDIDHLA